MIVLSQKIACDDLLLFLIFGCLAARIGCLLPLLFTTINKFYTHTHTHYTSPPSSFHCALSLLFSPSSCFPLICIVLQSFSLSPLASLYPIVSCLLYCSSSSSSSSTALSFLALPLLPQSPWRSTMWPSCWGVSPPTSAWAATSLWMGRWPTTSTSAPTTFASSETGSSPARTP